MMRRWILRVLALIPVLFAAAAVLVAASTSPDPWPPEEIKRLTAGLNEAAAIGVPHGFLMKKDMRAANLALLEKVEAGVVLTEGESRDYRALFQTVLFDSQSFLARFDGELTVIPDHAMDHMNNAGGSGIAGRHDHHDSSARNNFAGLITSLQALGQPATPFGRIRHANAAYKDLVDLISHLGVAPHTVSVAYERPETPWEDKALGARFEAMLKAFKAAQFEPVNSPPYWASVDAGLAAYNDLITAVQDRVNAGTAPWERRIAGRFLSLQTLAPPVDLTRPVRRH